MITYSLTPLVHFRREIFQVTSMTPRECMNYEYSLSFSLPISQTQVSNNFHTPTAGADPHTAEKPGSELVWEWSRYLLMMLSGWSLLALEASSLFCLRNFSQYYDVLNNYSYIYMY